ncbi:hypothetical protein KBD61_02960 [Patescibacteria group bacterium]|nr:hypothetical protein [Patescibacteria group bacterium]MBP9709962.1 hypothetical protein [Patescibacteria group bacterium]
MSRFESVPREIPAAIKPALTPRREVVTSTSPAKIEAATDKDPEVEALEEELEGLEAEITGTESDLAEAQAALAQQKDQRGDHSFIHNLFEEEDEDATAQIADLQNTIKECEEELAAAKQERAALIIKIEQAKD